MGDRFISYDFISFNMTKRYKKEERLSPRARKLIEEANKIPYFSARYLHAAMEHLKSIPPKELNLYDRQKVGRELRRENKAINKYDSDTRPSIEYAYDITNPENTERNNRYANQPGRISHKIEGKRQADKYFQDAQKNEKDETSFNPLRIFSVSSKYRKAGEIYEELGLINRALTSYENALKVIEQLPKTKEWSEDYKRIKENIRGYLTYVKNRQTERERRKQGGLEKTAVAASIVGIIGGLFFLSSNITGNAIANVSQSSGNILGAVLLVVGLVAGFFWVKKK